jgi:hypothetical protein
MSTESSESKEVSPVEKRAAWEAMKFRLGAPGAVRVENVSYGAESGERVYVVTVKDGAAIECTCPADGYQPGRCKHRHAVEANPAVLAAASAGVEELREARQ